MRPITQTRKPECKPFTDGLPELMEGELQTYSRLAATDRSNGHAKDCRARFSVVGLDRTPEPGIFLLILGLSDWALGRGGIEIPVTSAIPLSLGYPDS